MSNKVYIIGALILILGILLFAVGFSMAGFNIKNLSTEDTYEKKTFESSKDITAIIVADSNTDVEITASSDKKLHITYYENDKAYYEITEKNGTLNVVKKNSRNWHLNIFNFDLGKRTLSISVPAGFDGSVAVKTSNNSIVVTEIKASEMLLRTSNGRIGAENVKVTGLLDTNTSNGSINISGSMITGDVISRTSNGKIELYKVGCANAWAESSNGGITITSLNADGRIDAKTSNGRIEIDKIDFGTELSLTTSNNSIRGEINGRLTDYTVTSKTSNGKNNLPEKMKSGDRKINVTTSNGSIDIGFSEE